jgi:hypothetical protein
MPTLRCQATKAEAHSDKDSQEFQSLTAIQKDKYKHANSRRQTSQMNSGESCRVKNTLHEITPTNTEAFVGFRVISSIVFSFVRKPRAFLTTGSHDIAAVARAVLLIAAVLGLFCVPVSAQKLPSADKVVDGYLKAIGGKKRVASIRDATYEWTIQLKDQPMGIAKTQTKAPASVRTEMTFGNGRVVSGANLRSAWLHGLDGKLHTLTDAEAAAARLQASLDASRLVDIKKRNVLAKVVSTRNVGTDPAYVVEFSLRSGARLRYVFSSTTRLLLRIEDDARKATTQFEDYRTQGNILEPHRVSLSNLGSGELTFLLQKATYNTGLADKVFDPPQGDESVDVVALLREVSRNQDVLEQRFTEYSFVQKETNREINSKGEVKKETMKVFEVFPIANRAPVMKLISENGVPLSGERAEKEQKRVEEEFLKADRDKEKDAQRVQKYRAERERKKAARAKEGEDDDVEISQFFKVHEFVSPRRERFRERDAVVFDFRVRPGFKPSNREESLISKLVGVAWIDPADKQVMRLEARMAEGFKMGGGLLVNLRPAPHLLWSRHVLPKDSGCRKWRRSTFQ